jgi:hypothetical protein
MKTLVSVVFILSIPCWCSAVDLPIAGYYGNTDNLRCNANEAGVLTDNSVFQHGPTTLVQDDNEFLFYDDYYFGNTDYVSFLKSRYGSGHTVAVGGYRSSLYIYESPTCFHGPDSDFGLASDYAFRAYVEQLPVYLNSGSENSWFGANLDSSHSAFQTEDLYYQGGAPYETYLGGFYQENVYVSDVSSSSVRTKLAETLKSELSELGGVGQYHPDFIMIDDYGDQDAYQSDFSFVTANMSSYTDALHSIGIKHLANCGVKLGLADSFVTPTTDTPCPGWGTNESTWIAMLGCADGFVIEEPLSDIYDNTGVEYFFDQCFWAAAYGKSLILLADNLEFNGSFPDNPQFLAGAVLMAQAQSGYGSDHLGAGPVVSCPYWMADDPDWNYWGIIHGDFDSGYCPEYVGVGLVWATRFEDGYFLWVDFANHIADWSTGPSYNDVPQSILDANP